MFSVEFSIDKEIRPKPESRIPIKTFVVSNIKIYKLMTTVFSQLSWDVPVLHPTRSNVLLILALPPDKDDNDIISLVQRTRPEKNFSIFMLKHFMNSALIEFESQADADRFYVKNLGVPFDRTKPRVNCILLFIYKVCCNALPILPIKTMKEFERVEYELPLCPICFKLFDPLISCFFSECVLDDVNDEAYQQWGSPDCPVCKVLHRPEASASMSCSCGEKSNLWICMQCGHVGCERGSNRHAIEHYNKTNHRFAFRFDKMWLWDYFADRSVDRSFHTQPTANEGIVDVYRDMLVDGINDLHAKDEAEKNELHTKYVVKIESDKKEIAELTNECHAMEEDFAEADDLKKQLDAIMSAIDKIKKSPEMVFAEKQEQINARYKQRLKKINERQQIIYKQLEERSDVTNDVVIDF